MINRAPPISYDEVPYRSRSLPATHPDHMATLATLFGMQPTPVTRCRVLELGCAGGGNLVPMAYALPESSFVGIDLSAQQIAMGQRLVDTLGLRNIVLKHGDILDIGDDFGQFDYIIVYGIYSWVPGDVQEKILAICKRHLAPNGVAFVSYNTYPGWHMRGMIREMMIYHSQNFANADQRIGQARAVLDFLAEATATMEVNQPWHKIYNQLLEQERELIHSQPDFYLAHEHLSEVNEPIYFSKFVERATRHGLQYLADAQLSTMLPSTLPPSVAETLEGIAPDRIALEQFIDFLSNRTFRQSLLCHESVGLSSELDPSQIFAFQVASSARMVAPGEQGFSPGVDKFRTPAGSVISARSALSSAALQQLADIWPQAMPFDQLLARAQALAGSEQAPAQDAAPVDSPALRLADMILTCYSIDVVELRVHTPAFVLAAGAYPVASRYARLQVEREAVVTNLCHESVALDPACAAILPYLDGHHDRQALLNILEQHRAARASLAQQDGDPAEDTAEPEITLVEQLEDCLGKLARDALLLS